MGDNANRYQEMERWVTRILLGSLGAFLVFLIAAGCGIVWLKVLMAIIAIIACGLCLGHLYLTQELSKPRSRWMVLGAAAIIICIVFSLILNFPSPNPYS